MATPPDNKTRRKLTGKGMKAVRCMCRAPIAGARRAVECQTDVWACGRQAAPGAESGATEAGTRRSSAGDCNKTTGTEPSEGVLHDRVKNVNVLAVQAVDGSHPIKTKSSNGTGKGGGCAREQVQQKLVFGRGRVGGRRSRGVGPLNRSRVHDTRSGMTRVGWNAKSSAQRKVRGNK